MEQSEKLLPEEELGRDVREPKERGVMEVKRFSFVAMVVTANLMAIAVTVPQSHGAESSSTRRSQTQTVVAGKQYENPPGGRLMLGADYRDLWTTPIEVKVLDLQTAGGGLSPVRRVGGNQTLGLAMKGQDGLSYTFRAVDKSLSAIIPDEFKGTAIELIVNDQIAANFPGVQVVAPPLSEAAGVLHVDIQLVVMPDDPALGEYQKDFANVLGIFMEYPQPGFQGATRNLSSRFSFSRRTLSSRRPIFPAAATNASRSKKVMMSRSSMVPWR